MRLTRKLLGSAAMTASLWSVVATAQDIPASDASSAPAEDQTRGEAAEQAGDIVVTGSRIARRDFTAESPITTVNKDFIENSGPNTVDQALNALPQFQPTQNAQTSSVGTSGAGASGGRANANLRGLGPARTLVLFEGRRLQPSDTQGAIDLNTISSALISSVEVITGGASAVYGSDAISGVVNFILRDDLDGVRGDVQYGFAAHHNDNKGLRDLVRRNGYATALNSPVDGQRLDANIAVGKNLGDRGNITAYFGYRDVKPIIQANRDVSACALDPSAGNSAYTCGGSSNNMYGLFQPLTGPNAGTAYNNTRDGQKSWVPYDASFRYNTAPLNYFQRADVRYTAGAFAKYEFHPAAELYGSFMFMHDRSFSQVAPSALFQGTTYTINCDNPLLGAQQGQLLCGNAYGSGARQDLFIGYRPVAGNAQPRRDDLRRIDYRATAGLRGEIAEGIGYDVGGLYSRALLRETYMNDIDPVRANRGLQVVSVNGTPTCTAVVDGSDPDCVPLDVFRYNGIADSAFGYIYRPASTRGLDEEYVYTGSINADLTSYGVTLPWADHGLGLVVGVEHRREKLRFTADALSQQKGIKEAFGRFHVTDLFTEVRLPIVEGKAFAEELSITGGYRYSDYSNLAKGVSTYKGELSWAPVRDLRLRASYNRAIRAPNISELFAAQQVGNVSAQDPCSGATPIASAERCALTGVSAAQYGRIIACPTDVCSAQSGGNLALRPEEADTYTAGVVLSPAALRGVSLSVDYFRIKVRDYIAPIPASLTISQCVATGDPFFCGLFRRDPRNGVLFGENGYVVSTTQNTGSLRTSGIDVGLNAAVPVGALGRVDLSLVGTWLNDLVNEPLPGLGSYDCKGLFGPTCGQPSPAWRHQARLTWAAPGDKASVSLNWRYIGATRLSSNTDNPFLAGDRYTLNSRIGTYQYVDLAVTAALREGVGLRLGVNNLLDRDPPAIVQGLLAAFGNGNTYPGVYDVAGRSFFVGLSAEF